LEGVLPPESVSFRLLVTPSYANKALKKTKSEIHQYVTLEEKTADHISEIGFDRLKLQHLLKPDFNNVLKLTKSRSCW